MHLYAIAIILVHFPGYEGSASRSSKRRRETPMADAGRAVVQISA